MQLAIPQHSRAWSTPPLVILTSTFSIGSSWSFGLTNSVIPNIFPLQFGEKSTLKFHCHLKRYVLQLYCTDFSFSWIDIYSDNPSCSGFFCSHSCSKSHSAQPPNSHSRSRPNFSGIESCTVSGGDGTSNQANFIQWRSGIDLFAKID